MSLPPEGFRAILDTGDPASAARTAIGRAVQDLHPVFGVGGPVVTAYRRSSPQVGPVTCGGGTTILGAFDCRCRAAHAAPRQCQIVSDVAFRTVVWPHLRLVNAQGTKLSDAILPDVIPQPRLEQFYPEKTAVTKAANARKPAQRPAGMPRLRITN